MDKFLFQRNIPTVIRPVLLKSADKYILFELREGKNGQHSIYSNLAISYTLKYGIKWEGDVQALD